MNNIKPCPICNKQNAEIFPEPTKQLVGFKCANCGIYQMTFNLYQVFNQDNSFESKNYILAGYMWETKNRKVPLKITWTPDPTNEFYSAEFLISNANVPKNPFEQIDLILMEIYKRTTSFGDEVIVRDDEYPISYSKDPLSFRKLLGQAAALKYINDIYVDNKYVLTLDAYKRLDEINKRKIVINQAFVAMWFHTETNDAWEVGIKPALEEVLKIKPVRIDLEEHNEWIVDRIIAEINKSRFLIADLTGNRNGVYFEAGYAKGLNLPVIFTCHEDHFNNRHFDISQVNTIKWKTPEDLKERLINRITATIIV